MEHSTTIVAFLWSLVGFAALFKVLVPPDFYRLLDDFQRWIFQRCALFHDIVIPQSSGVGSNHLYSNADLYLATLQSSAQGLTAVCHRSAKKISFAIAPNEQTFEDFRGHRFKWSFQLTWRDSMYRKEEVRSYKLVVPRAARDLVPEYLNLVMERGEKIAQADCEKKLYTNMRDSWRSIPFKPPCRFDTIAMDPQQKKLLLDDLARFLDGKDYYERVGRAWKRGYLLHGPPGTGKSSLIAAISNFTGFDVYDLELTKVKNNIELRQLLIGIDNRAIVVVEDIDCTISLKKRQKSKSKREEEEEEDKNREEEQEKGVTLSGLLNFTDGLWSSCGSQRIFIFTTNYIERLDDALRRPGRMDMHIEMSYCSFPVFKALATTFLKIEHHELFAEIEALLGNARITPASVVEELLRHSENENPGIALESLAKTLSGKKEEDSAGRGEDEISCAYSNDDNSDGC